MQVYEKTVYLQLISALYTWIRQYRTRINTYQRSGPSGAYCSITDILSGYDVDIMDIGQADIHSTLSLGILFKCSEQDSGNIMKNLLFKASELGINIRFYPISREEYEDG